MEIQNISEVHGEATITLTEKELFMIAAALESKEKIIEHLKKYELELVDFKGLEVNDYGGAIIY